jgi:hypothetical protein
MWWIGPGAVAAVPALVEALKDRDREVRCSAAGALGAMGSAAQAAISALTEALGDEDPDARQFAARALVRAGDRKARATAAPVLREQFHKGVPDSRVRGELILLLWMIGPERESTFPGLQDGDAGDIVTTTQLLPKADEQTRRNAVAALRGSKSNAHRADLARVLGGIAPAAGEAIPVLVDAVKDKDEGVRKEAAAALKKVQQE